LIQAGSAPLAPAIGTALVTRMHELLALQARDSREALGENCPDPGALTGREREILLLLREGASNQEIADRLTIEVGTAKNHVHSILKKLNVARRDQAARYVGLLEQITVPPGTDRQSAGGLETIS
jgi:DNA-binding NarL/FixJ family response regulator